MNDPYFSADNSAGKPKAVARPTRRWAVEVLVCIALGVPVGGCLLYPIVTSENFGKPIGRAIPTELPDEANRVHHPGGFSLVYPPNWEAWASPEPAAAGVINGYPRSLIPRRHGPVITVFKLGAQGPPDLADLRSTRFQGRPAYEMGRTREVWYEDAPRFTYRLAFLRGECWYTLSYIGDHDARELPAMIRRYLSTFRIERSRDRD